MRSKFLVLVLVQLFNVSAMAADLREFVSDCAWGTMGGAVAGVVSMALTDKPSQHTRNIAMGASLGLYAGIGYGLYKINRGPSYNEYVRVGVAPVDQNGSWGLVVKAGF